MTSPTAWHRCIGRVRGTNDVKRQEEIGAELRELEETLSTIRLRHDDSRNFAEDDGGPR
jgi:hypothetical protein